MPTVKLRSRAARRKNLEKSRHQLSYEALRASLLREGQLLPVYRLGRVIVDGRRRESILLGIGRTPEYVDLRDHQAAARVLWMLHPRQAWLEYGAPEPRTLTEQAEYFGVAASDIARVRAAERPPAPRGTESRPRYRAAYNRLQRYLSRVREGLETITLGGVEHAIKLRDTVSAQSTKASERDPSRFATSLD